jgi:hypothetical protein
MRDWPTGKVIQVAKIRPSECDEWMARYQFGSASRNLYIACLRERWIFGNGAALILRAS